MNITTLLLVVFALLCAAMFLRWTLFPREEVHNSDAPNPNPGPPEEAPKSKPQAEAPKPKPKAEASKPNDPEEIPDQEIMVKMRAGLTRAQAVEVIRNQREHDKALAKAAKEAK